jgi:hypothetical protein
MGAHADGKQMTISIGQGSQSYRTACEISIMCAARRLKGVAIFDDTPDNQSPIAAIERRDLMLAQIDSFIFEPVHSRPDWLVGEFGLSRVNGHFIRNWYEDLGDFAVDFGPVGWRLTGVRELQADRPLSARDLEFGGLKEHVGSQFLLGRSLRVDEHLVAFFDSLFGCLGTSLGRLHSGSGLSDRCDQRDDLAEEQESLNPTNYQ